MERQDSGKRGLVRLGVIAGLVVVVALVGLNLTDEPEADPSPKTAAPANSGLGTVVTTPTRTPARLQDEDPEPVDDIPRAVQPRADQAWSLLRLPLTCEVEPPVVGPPVVGEATPVTWPGADHDPQPDGVAYPAIPMRITVDAGEATGTTFLPVLDSGGERIRHVARLVLPGFAPTEFTFVTTGPDQPITCDGPIELGAAAHGVVGVVRFQDGSPAEGAIVDGCGTRVITGSGGDYFLLPRAEEPCSLRARHAPGTAAESAPERVDPAASEDLVLDFVVEMPDQPDPGLEIFRTEDGEVWARPGDSGPWARKLYSGARILRVGDVPADSLSDEELLRAMVHLDEAVHIQQYFESEDGEGVRANTSVTEL